MDSITDAQIAADITDIERIYEQTMDEDEFISVNGCLSRVIAHLYIARGFASPDLPRNYEYYRNIQESK
jgi:hypothetical protein